MCVIFTFWSLRKTFLTMMPFLARTPESAAFGSGFGEGTSNDVHPAAEALSNTPIITAPEGRVRGGNIVAMLALVIRILETNHVTVWRLAPLLAVYIGDQLRGMCPDKLAYICVLIN
jgi:hypothetical protein